MIVKMNQMYLQTCLQTHQGELIIVTDASTELEQAGQTGVLCDESPVNSPDLT